MPKTYQDLVDDIIAEYKKTMNWRAVAKGFNVPERTLWRIAKDETYEPKRPDIRRKLGLAPLSNVVPVNGFVQSGSQALTSHECAICNRPYISNHPRRRKCFICSPYRGKR